MNILVTGASGLLGAHIVARLEACHDVTGLDRNAWWGDQPIKFLQGDLEETSFLKNAIATCLPDVVIHCAGMVDVDACERDPGRAFRSNAELTRQLVLHTPTNCPFVYISTDSVFSGESAFWTEGQEPSPRNVYARSKLQGEHEVAKLEKYLIVRTNFYGWSSGRKKTSAEWLHNALRNGEPITLFDDYFSTPIYAADLARSVSAMVSSRQCGLFHIAGRDRVSKYEFGATMARLMRVSMSNVRRGTIASATLYAPRPRDISLSTDRVSQSLGFGMPGCEEGLRRFLTDRGRPLSQI